MVRVILERHRSNKIEIVSILLDTNVLSELARPEPQESVVDFCRGVRSAFVSVVTLHELTYGARLVKAKTKQKKLLNWISEMQTNYEQSILDVTVAIANRAAEMRASAAAKGVILHIEDSLIAASALEHSLQLATRNVKDFKGLSVKLVDPWSL